MHTSDLVNEERTMERHLVVIVIDMTLSGTVLRARKGFQVDPA